MSMTTHFAPAGRASETVLQAEAKAVRELPMVAAVLDSVGEMVLVLNGFRQIVFANQAFADFAAEPDPRFLVGLRPGEAMGCLRALEDGKETDGCGTTRFCRTCGAANAILTCQATGRDIQECRIVLAEDGEALDLRVQTTQLDLGGETYTVFSARDISAEKRRDALERIFFHDILNTATGVKGMADVFEIVPADQQVRFRKRIRLGVGAIIDEVQSQQLLMAAEKGQLACEFAHLRSADLAAELVSIYTGQPCADGRHLMVGEDSENVEFETDSGLISRVLGNMLKNALEASKPEERVTISCRQEDDRVRFDVHNPAVMSEDVKLQVFQRSFSTKGAGRGLGTYSIRLISEKYLGGNISFTSVAEAGTVFSGIFPLTPEPQA